MITSDYVNVSINDKVQQLHYQYDDEDAIEKPDIDNNIMYKRVENIIKQ